MRQRQTSTYRSVNDSLHGVYVVFTETHESDAREPCRVGSRALTAVMGYRFSNFIEVKSRLRRNRITGQNFSPLSMSGLYVTIRSNNIC